MVRYFYKDDKLVDHKGNAVMMGWEKPIMRKVPKSMLQVPTVTDLVEA